MSYKTWNEFLECEMELSYLKELNLFLHSEYENKVVYPPRDMLFNAFALTPLESVKVVIIGQDPYHEPNQAMGLAFSVPSGMTLPPSLQNIYKEIQNDICCNMNKNGDLSYLARQGVLLLNAILSVRKGEPLSHANHGYEILLRHVLELLNSLNQPIVFILWGAFAKKLQKYLTNPLHLILTSNHPSPLSANRGGFFGNHHFSKVNDYLLKNNLTPIEWKN